MGLRRWWREKRIRWAESALDDAWHQVNLWGDHFGVSPSVKRADRERVERLERKLAKLRGGE